MATNALYTNLLGYDPFEEERNRQKLWAGLYSGASSPWEKVGIGIGQLGGALFGGESRTTTDRSTIDKTIAEVSKEYQQNSPDFWKALASRLPEGMSNAKSYAMSKATEVEAANTKALREDVKFYNENPSVATEKLQELQSKIETVATKLGYDPTRPETLTPQIQAVLNARPETKQYNAISNAYQQGFYENQKKLQEAPTAAADRAVYEDFVRQSDGDIVTAAKRFNQYKTDLKQKENTPLVAGEVKPGDINTLVSSVNTNLKPLDTKLRTYNEIRALIQEVQKGNTAAVPQLERFMAKAAGDNQLSATEIKQLANSGGFVEKTVGGVQKFVLGTPTVGKLNNTIDVINSLERQTAKEYNTTRDKLEATWNTSSLPKQTLDAALGSRYIPVSQRNKFSPPPAAAPKAGKMVQRKTASGNTYTVLEEE